MTTTALYNLCLLWHINLIFVLVGRMEMGVVDGEKNYPQYIKLPL